MMGPSDEMLNLVQSGARLVQELISPVLLAWGAWLDAVNYDVMQNVASVKGQHTLLSKV